MKKKGEDTNILKNKMVSIYFGIDAWTEIQRIAIEEETSASEICRRWIREKMKQTNRKGR
jgi:hypothetical protein